MLHGTSLKFILVHGCGRVKLYYKIKFEEQNQIVNLSFIRFTSS